MIQPSNQYSHYNNITINGGEQVNPFKYENTYGDDPIDTIIKTNYECCCCNVNR